MLVTNRLTGWGRRRKKSARGLDEYIRTESGTKSR
jgi:hypothetical protein